MQKRLLSLCFAVIMLLNSLGLTAFTVKAEEVLFKNDACTIEYEITSQWDSGYNVDIIISNTADVAIADWAFEIQTKDTVSNLWNAEYEPNDNGYNISACDWNRSIAPNASIVVGYTASCTESEMSIPFIEEDKVSIEIENSGTIDGNDVYCGENFEVSYEVIESWGNASNVKVTIKNLSDDVIHNWGLRFISSDTFDNIYNGVETGEGDVHIIKNAGWNQDIPANGSVEFGFIQKYSTEIEIPVDFELVSTEKVVENSNYSVDVIDEMKGNEDRTIQLVIENFSDTTIEDWTLEFEGNFEVIEIWNGELISQDSNKITLRNASYAQNILSNESCFIGMNIKCSEESVRISNCILKETKPHSETQENLSLINEVFFETYSLTVNEKLFFTVWAKTVSEENAEMKMYKRVGDEWVYVADLYDSGNLMYHDDEIKNDGIYTNTISLCETSPGVVQYKLSLICDGVEKESVIRDIVVVETISKEEYDKFVSDIDGIMDSVQQYMNSNEYIYDVTVDEIVSYISEKCNMDTDITDIERVNGSSIKITWSNVLNYYIQFSDKSDMDTMIRGAGSASSNNTSGVIEIANTKSRRILYWAPFDTEWGKADETESIKSIVSESAYSEDFDAVSDADANVDSLKKINDYGLIIFATHGIGGEWIVTGEKVTSEPQYLKEMTNQQISVYCDYDPSDNSYESYYMVNDKWFLENVQNTMADSIIINNSCESSKTDILWDAFKELGAKTYYGNDGAITNHYATIKCSALVSKLVLDREITGDAIETSLDAYYNDGAAFVARGQGNLALSNCISNSNFEGGTNYWAKLGDFRALNRLGNIGPTEGNYMGMISTGIGYNMKGGAIAQRISVPQEANSLYFNWNFLSAEFLEYINSEYNDPFEVIIECTDDTQEKTLIYRKSVNSLAKEFGATSTSAGKLICVSPSVQINGYEDIWMTGWQAERVDISKYAGKTITLTFGVNNAADTDYPSAVLLDNIHLDTEYGTSYHYEEIENPGTITPDSNGRSYLFYSADFIRESSAVKEQIKYENGYTDDRQVVAELIETEREFVNFWNNMIPGNGETAIDSVVIMMHGNYYAIIIDNALNESETAYAPGKIPQNLTVSKDGKVGSDCNATYIGDLSKKNIHVLKLYSCNVGLLDAINIDIKKEISQDITHTTGQYQINGNVAQAFLDNNISKVLAYDGSVTIKEDGTLRLSYDERKYLDYVDFLSEHRKVVPYRFNGGMNYFDLRYVGKTGPDAYEAGVMPNGEVTYFDSEEAVYNYYQLETKYTTGITPVAYKVLVKHRAKIDLYNNFHQRIE